jgi:hypothetical protein
MPVDDFIRTILELARRPQHIATIAQDINRKSSKRPDTPPFASIPIEVMPLARSSPDDDARLAVPGNCIFGNLFVRGIDVEDDDVAASAGDVTKGVGVTEFGRQFFGPFPAYVLPAPYLRSFDGVHWERGDAAPGIFRLPSVKDSGHNCTPFRARIRPPDAQPLNFRHSRQISDAACMALPGPIR